jgi:YHS domain-containing protein
MKTSNKKLSRVTLGLALLLAAAGLVTQAHAGSSKMAAPAQHQSKQELGSATDLERYYETSPLLVSGSTIKIKNSRNGVVISVSAKDQQTVQTIQKQARTFQEEKSKIDKEPATCPVMGTKLTKGKAYNTAVYNGKVYYFCCGACKPSFEKDPQHYADQ